MAAGLDARAFRLACLRECAVYEIDQPEVLEFNLAALAVHDVAPIAMLEHGFQSWTPTAWLTEGLLPTYRRRHGGV
jgi:O-methyltransferase involved in polyketide biosynthesis